jgi:phosphatidylserine/phosphatidylglycerophosphate/cardiolipin synthase-like enzyme
MAKFLNTTGVSYHLEELMKGTKTRLILISPYLQFHDRIKEHLEYLRGQKKEIHIVFRENKLQSDEKRWLNEKSEIKISFNKNLHAKCYINENEAIITSMNLYEFSQQNNNEMGIHISKSLDPDLYNSTLEEAERLLYISENVKSTICSISTNVKLKSENKEISVKIKPSKKESFTPGFCIRTGAVIPFDIFKPLSYEAFKSWNQHANIDYPEKYCHFSGEPSNGETCVEFPILKKNWKRAQEKFDL